MIEKPMKSLAVGEVKYIITDAEAREDIEELKSNLQYSINQTDLPTAATSYPFNFIAGHKYRLTVVGSDITSFPKFFTTNDGQVSGKVDDFGSFGNGEKTVELEATANATHIRKSSHAGGSISFTLTDLSSIDERLTKAEEDIETLQTNVTNINTDVTEIEGDVTDLKSQITQKTRNIFDNGAFDIDTITLDTDGYYVGTVRAFYNAFSSILPVDGVFESNARYTISFDYYISDIGDYTHNAIAIKANYTDSTGANICVMNASIATPTAIQGTTAAAKTIDHLSMAIVDSRAFNYLLHIKNMQVEIGTEKTAFTPHITAYDAVAEAQIAALETTVDGITQDVSDLSQTVSGYASRIDAVEQETNQTATEFDAFLNGVAFDYTQSATLEYAIPANTDCILDVQTRSGSASVFTVGYGSDVYAVITAAGKYEFTTLHDGNLRFYVGPNSSINGKLYLKTRFDTSESSETQTAIPVLDAIAIKTIKAFDSFDTVEGSYSFDGTATIDNYRNYATTSTYAHNTPPVAIRDQSGALIYSGLRLNENVDSTSIAFWVFGKDGYFLRKVSFQALAQRSETFLADEYYAILNQFYGFAKAYWIVSDINIEWLNLKSTVYTVGGSSADFATFTTMLIALSDDTREKTVYVNPGEYDIFAEMGGADYIASISPQASSLNWRDVCHVVPPNTTIIGLGNVVLKWLPTAEQMINSETAFLFSPLNISGTCTIKNIKVQAQNCRYVVHDETSGIADYNGSKHHYIDCVFTLLPGTYGTYVYGAGHNKLMEVTFDRCIVESQNSVGIWSTHDAYAAVNDRSRFSLTNCVFVSNKADPYIQFSSSDQNGRKDEVMICNCHIPKIRMVTDGSSAKQGYDVTLIGCNNVPVEYSNLVTDRYVINQYNSIS